MLYDPKWEGKATVKREPSLRGFIEWIETKEPKETYNWCSISHCACRQYFDSIGSGYEHRIAQTLDIIAYGGGEGWTFGELLDRVKAAS
jgi:hypothetical protein